MAKKGILFLLIIGLFVFVGCDGENSVSIADTIIEDYTEWGEGTAEEPYVSFLLEGSDLETMDIGWEISESSGTYLHYTVTVLEVRNNKIIGTYFEDSNEDENRPIWDVEITFSYTETTLTLNISGGDLNGETYTLEPSAI